MEGRELAGRYRLRERIGAGGMASVFRAWDDVLSRHVAVKLVDPALLADPAFRERFRDEARAVGGLSHPRIVTVHDYGEAEGTPYLVMELLDGETLADRLARGPVPPGEAGRLCGQIAVALAVAHRAGIVHGDVKPANVFLTVGGARLLDFGLAQAARDVPGPRLGTPAYLAPEQLSGGPAGPEADVFALGIVLFEMLTGSRPASRPSPAGPPVLPPEVPAELRELCGRCLRTDAAGRPSAGQIASALGVSADEDVPAATGVAGVPAPTLVLTGPAWVRPRWVVAGAVAAVAVLASLLAWGSAELHPAVSPAPATPAPPTASAQTGPSQIGSVRGGSAAAAEAISALTGMRRTVDEGAAAGEVRPDVAVDFDNLISTLLNQLAAGQSVDLGQRVGQLSRKIDERVGEGGLSPDWASELRDDLSYVSPSG